QRRHGCRRHPVPPQRRQSCAHRTGLESAVTHDTEAMTHPGVTVATVLRDLAETRGFDLELVAGAGGVDRRITNPHPQKTGLALSGFDQYCGGGGGLVFGESEVRFLESLSPDARAGIARRVFSHNIPCLVITAGFAPPQELCDQSDLMNLPLMRARAATPL